ncbi:transcriptional regulator 4 [Achromobacter xylosoxidans A8]|uniref:Transcriptional regulator 4 n=1 Tax=Achromobacter xylosoxidans (strain A8) TaxID=762376 RepID=E3HLL4_ACHXA|nr:transcriptional regulator [Achromobacter xylosoxidans]ADP19349.1 transcriptional regulator 4 [Achromobacter xylosoxidans A8]
MEQRGSVFVVRLDETAGEDFAEALRLLRWQARVFDTSAGVLEHLQAQAADALVLLGGIKGVPALIAMLRRAAPAAAVLWHAAAASASDRIAALDAGADVCMSADRDVLEWDALLRNLHRRAPAVALPWRLDPHAGALAGPAGEYLPLTVTERAFFVRLLNAPGYCLRRECFFPAGTRKSLDGARRVDVLLSRLRSKARRLNIDLPVLAVRGWGYILLPEGAARG